VENKKYRVLVVDDERDIVSLIKQGLEREGMFEVDALHDPEEAVNHFKPGRCQLPTNKFVGLKLG
jgi:PleD family two-component response regulator